MDIKSEDDVLSRSQASWRRGKGKEEALALCAARVLSQAECTRSSSSNYLS